MSPRKNVIFIYCNVGIFPLFQHTPVYVHMLLSSDGVAFTWLGNWTVSLSKILSFHQYKMTFWFNEGWKIDSIEFYQMWLFFTRHKHIWLIGLMSETLLLCYIFVCSIKVWDLETMSSTNTYRGRSWNLLCIFNAKSFKYQIIQI